MEVGGEGVPRFGCGIGEGPGTRRVPEPSPMLHPMGARVPGCQGRLSGQQTRWWRPQGARGSGDGGGLGDQQDGLCRALDVNNNGWLIHREPV